MCVSLLGLKMDYQRYCIYSLSCVSLNYRLEMIKKWQRKCKGHEYKCIIITVKWKLRCKLWYNTQKMSFSSPLYSFPLPTATMTPRKVPLFWVQEEEFFFSWKIDLAWWSTLLTVGGKWNQLAFFIMRTNAEAKLCYFSRKRLKVFSPVAFGGNGCGIRTRKTEEAQTQRGFKIKANFFHRH